jgi:Skp family chaperone for outer membrane proteins
MIRKTVPYGKKKYVYYVCANHKEHKACYPHSLRTEALESLVLEALQAHIQEVIDLDNLSKLVDSARLQQAIIQKMQARLDKKQAEIDRLHTLLRSLYENLTDGILDRNEYRELKKTYTQRREEAEQQAETLREEMGRELASVDNSWIEHFRQNQNITALDRRLVVSLIERVMVFRDKRVEIVCRWQNEFEVQAELLRMAQAERQVG